MKRKAWKAKIKTACIEAGTYKPIFDSIIDTLAGVLEKRDEAEEMYDDDEEARIVITMTNKSGFTNTVKNPLIVLWDDLNKSALSYWRELGLTPAGLKKLNEETFTAEKKEKGNSLLELLEKGKKDE